MAENEQIPDVNALTIEEQQELQMAAEAMGLGYPREEDKANIYTLFKRFFESKDSSKIGNLDEKELYAVRILKRAGIFANILGYKLVSEYLGIHAETLLATSMAKDFAFVRTIGTQKRILESSNNEGGKKKWSLFGKKEQPQQQV